MSLATLAIGMINGLGLSKSAARQITRWVASPRRVRKTFGDYAAGEHDVFVASFMKSGTNWMMQLATQTAWRGEADFDHIHDLVAWPDTPVPGPVPLTDPTPWQSAPTGLRVIKTHAPAALVPWSPDARYLVVLRDPKEVMVSAYHFALPLMGMVGHITPEDWLDLYMSDRAEGSNLWANHVLSWWALRDKPNVEVFFYDDMKADLPGTVDRVAQLMGVVLDAEQRAAVVERSGFKWMKAHQSQFLPTPLPGMAGEEMPDMIRRGATGGANELYSAAQLDRIDATILSALQHLKSDFPYRKRWMKGANGAEADGGESAGGGNR
jgi:hypothetical protein